MERINGHDTVDIGGGKRGFRSQNALAGVNGTEVTDAFLNSVQEEICTVIEKAGIVLDTQKNDQLHEALMRIVAPGFGNRIAWMPVLSVTVTAPPTNAALGDAYIIPTGATGVWAGQAQKLAEWNGTSWNIITTKDGHGVSLPDGRVFEKIGGIYVEKIALDAQSGKWNYAIATGTANALIVALTPSLPAYVGGLSIIIRPATANTGAVTINVNDLGARPVLYSDGRSLFAGELSSDREVRLDYSPRLTAWIIGSPPTKLGTTCLRDQRDPADCTNSPAISANNTLVGEVTLPAGHVAIYSTVDVYISGDTSPAVIYGMGLYYSVDGGAWQLLETQNTTKPAGNVLISMSRAAVRNLDVSKSHRFRATICKYAPNGTLSPISGNLQIMGFKL